MVAFLSAPTPVFSVCTISVISGVNFGTYAPFTSGNVDTTGQVQVTGCVIALTYQISLNAGTGSSGSFTPRQMSQSTNTINYNLYTTAARTTIWGDGTNGTSVVSQLIPILCTLLAPCIHTVYGRIPGGQTSVAVGNYTDTITATLTF